MVVFGSREHKNIAKKKVKSWAVCVILPRDPSFQSRNYSSFRSVVGKKLKPKHLQEKVVLAPFF